MAIIQRLYKFYINSSLHVAFSALSLCHITLFYYDVSPSISFQILIFCATVLGYNFVKYFGLARFHYRSLTTNLKEIQILSGFCFIAFSLAFIALEIRTKIAFLILGCVTFLYANPLNFIVPLRQVKGLKIYIIALVWAAVTVLLPVLDLGGEINSKLGIKLFERFVFVFILMLPFEIRDLSFDDLKLSTIPQKIGINKTKLIGYFGIVLLFSIMVVSGSFRLMSSSLFMLSMLGLALYKSKENNAYDFTAFWVESIPIFWWICIFILELN